MTHYNAVDLLSFTRTAFTGSVIDHKKSYRKFFRMMFPLDLLSPPSQESNATNLFFQIRPVTRFFEQIKIFVPIGLYYIETTGDLMRGYIYKR